MMWAILLAFLVIVGVMSLIGRQQVSWVSKLFRVSAGVAHKAEWMAPEDIVKVVEQNYLEAMRWLPESMLDDWSAQWSAAPEYLSGLCLRRHQEILKHYRMGKPPRYVGILRCIHQIEVRYFSEDGERCLIIDKQSSRRMATYDYRTQARLNTQDLGDGTVVYEMAYDKKARRWKLERFIQELPVGWKTGKKSSRVRLLSASALPPSVGRDN